MPSTTSRETLAGIDRAIRAGLGSRAKEALSELTKKRMGREGLWRVAALARRAELPLLGLRLLKPYVRGDRRIAAKPSPEEKCEYAGCLIRLGATMEAKAILSSLDAADAERIPDIAFFLGSALVNEWNYREAIPFFLQYTRHPKVTGYARLVGKANLADACVAEGEFRKAAPLLRELLYRGSIQKLHLLLGKAFELSAQSFLLQGKLDEAAAYLERAEKQLGKSEGLDEFFVRKWKAILELLREPSSDRSLANLYKIRQEAAQRRHWETVRSCDHFEASARKDEHLLLHVYFGTPYEGFRKHLLRGFDRTPIPDCYEWRLSQRDGVCRVRSANDRDAVCPVIDITSSRAQGRSSPLRSGGQLHGLLSLLVADFYRPVSVAMFHAFLSPGEFFDPLTSRARIHTAMTRFRSWVSKQALPITVEERNGSYRLVAKAPCAIRVDGKIRREKGYNVDLIRLHEQWGGKFFSAHEAADVLGLPPRSMHRRLAQGVREGALTRLGQGPSTRYSFAKG